MAKQTQYHKMFMLLKGAPNGLSKEDLGKAMAIAPVSVPVYIFELKKQFKCDIVSVRQGKTVVAYKLVNGEKAKVPEFRRGSSQPVAKKPAKVGEGTTTLDAEGDITQVGDREMADIRSSLGITGFSGRGGSGDY